METPRLLIYIDNATTPILPNLIYENTFRLNKSICSEDNLRFGGCESAFVTFTMVNSELKLKDKKLTIKWRNNNKVTPLGVYYVNSAKPSMDKKNIEVVAYDKLYKIRSVDLTDWYKNLVFPMNLKKFRSLLFDKLEVEQVEITLPNDNAIIQQTKSITGIYGLAVIYDICAINGSFGYINNDGLFDYLFLSKDASKAINIPRNLQKEFSYEDYITHKINQIRLTQPEVDFEFSYGKGDNGYPISLTVINFGNNKEILSNICQNIYPYISDIQFTPIEMVCAGNPELLVGTYIKTLGYKEEELYSYILVKELAVDGHHSLTDTYTASGTQFYTRNTEGLLEAVYNIDNQIKTVYKNNFYAYTFTNEEEITVAANDKIIIKYNISATSATDVLFIATLPIILNTDCRAKINYYRDGELITNDTVYQDVSKGYQIISLSNYFHISEDGRLTLTVGISLASYHASIEDRLESIESYVSTGNYTQPLMINPSGIIYIHTIKSILFAKGLSGEAPWDGTINLVDNVSMLKLTTANNIDLFGIGDMLNIPLIPNKFMPITSNIVDELALNTKSSIDLNIFDELIFDNIRLYYLIGVDKAGSYQYDATKVSTEDGKFSLLENEEPQNIITGDIGLTIGNVNGIENITSVYTGTPTIALSFDSGLTWVGYFGNEWVQITEDYSGMTLEAAINITNTDWAYISLNQTNVRFRLTLSDFEDTITEIKIIFTHTT